MQFSEFVTDEMADELKKHSGSTLSPLLFLLILSISISPLRSHPTRFEFYSSLLFRVQPSKSAARLSSSCGERFPHCQTFPLSGDTFRFWICRELKF